MATCSLLMATCSVLWLPVVHYGNTYSLPSVLSSLLHTATQLWQRSLHCNRLCAALSALPTYKDYKDSRRGTLQNHLKEYSGK